MPVFMTVFVKGEFLHMRKIKIKRENSRVLPKVIALTFLITSVVIAFVVFMNYNNREVVMEASSYLEGVCRRCEIRCQRFSL